VDNIAEFNGAILTSMAQHKRKKAEGGEGAKAKKATKKDKTETRHNYHNGHATPESESEDDLEREVDEFVKVERT
jgi:hypothetical protein